MAKLTKKQRSLAAKRGAATRKRNAEHAKRSRAAKKGWRTRQGKQRSVLDALPRTLLPPALPRQEYLIVIDYKKRPRGFHADLFMVSVHDATPTQLADQARSQLPEGKSFLANWIEGGYSEITKGKATSAPKSTRVRSFMRYKQR